MQFIFKSGYICCGCGKRYTIEHTNAIFKRSCICNECYSQIEKVPHYSSFAGTKYCDFVVSPFFYKDLYRDIFLQCTQKNKKHQRKAESEAKIQRVTQNFPYISFCKSKNSHISASLYLMSKSGNCSTASATLPRTLIA